ncbi:hypothetical protein EH223_08525 [candidate division KSB1 bacterium]|nr:MAG: hypothetical protein EH223_08525 [candidate division KSB1 bacterium]
MYEVKKTLLKGIPGVVVMIAARLILVAAGAADIQLDEKTVYEIGVLSATLAVMINNARKNRRK